MRESDLVATRAPFGRGGTSAEEAYPALVAAVDIHHVDLLTARTVAFEDDPAPVGGIGTADVDPRRIGQTLRRAAACRGHRIYVGIACHGHRVEQAAAVG